MSKKRLIVIFTVIVYAIITTSCRMDFSGVEVDKIESSNMAPNWCDDIKNINTPRCAEILDREKLMVTKRYFIIIY